MIYDRIYNVLPIYYNVHGDNFSHLPHYLRTYTLCTALVNIFKYILTLYLNHYAGENIQMTI